MILDSKTVNNVQIDPQTTEIWSIKLNTSLWVSEGVSLWYLSNYREAGILKRHQPNTIALFFWKFGLCEISEPGRFGHIIIYSTFAHNFKKRILLTFEYVCKGLYLILTPNPCSGLNTWSSFRLSSVQVFLCGLLLDDLLEIIHF